MNDQPLPNCQSPLILENLTNITAYEVKVTATDVAGNTQSQSVQLFVSFMEPTYRSLNARVFSRRCAGCHNSVTLSGGLDLTTYTKVVSVITPNDAATSKIYMRVSGSSPGANRMPLGGAPLSDLEIGAIAAWINAGALNN